MFARIARRYDLANRILSGGMDIRWRKRLVATARQHGPTELLDLATGSGDVAFALAAGVPTAKRVVGMDFCLPMLEEAERKKMTTPAASHVSFQPGDILSLPAADASVDLVTISFGLRNLADRHRGLSEMHRVLRPGGRLLVLEFSQPSRWFRPFYYFYLSKVLPRLAGWVTGDRAAYDYLNCSIEAFPAREALTEELRRAGFTDVNAQPMTFGIVALHAATK